MPAQAQAREMKEVGSETQPTCAPMRNKYPRHRPQSHVNTYEVDDDLEEIIDEGDGSGSGWRIKFGIRGLLMLMLISSVLFAGGGYLLHAVRGGVRGRGFQLTFILFTLVAPIALMMAFAIVAWILRLPVWHHESNDPDDGE